MFKRADDSIVNFWCAALNLMIKGWYLLLHTRSKIWSYTRVDGLSKYTWLIVKEEIDKNGTLDFLDGEMMNYPF